MIEPVKFVFNKRGKKIAAIISIEEYEKILAKLGNMKRIRAHERAKAKPGVTLEVALARLRRSR
jgi:hypothetical protein